MIGVFIDTGVPPASSTSQQSLYNRSYEYDALGERYARFLTEDLPELCTPLQHFQKSKRLRQRRIELRWYYRLQRGLEPTGCFSPRCQFIGSYTNLRSGNTLASLIRKTRA
jgi:enterochelin esterase family protein